MRETIRKRLEELQAQWVSVATLNDYYGIDVETSDQEAVSVLRGRMQYWSSVTWSNRPEARRIPVRNEGSASEEWNRTTLELFLQDQRSLPWKWAAASVGMSEASLRRVIESLNEAGWGVAVWDQSGLLLRRDLDTVLRENVPGLRNRTFFNRTQRNCALHEALENEFPGLSIDRLLCVTTEFLGEPSEHATQFDALTDEPIGVRHVVWLDLGKPAALPPDAVSTLTYLQYETELRRLALPVRADPELESVRLERQRRGA